MTNEREQGTIGALSAQRNGDSYTITLDANAWTNLLALLDYTSTCAGVEHEGLMKQGADEMMAALLQAETDDQPESEAEP